MLDINCLRYMLKEKLSQLDCADDSTYLRLEIEIGMIEATIKEYGHELR